MRIVFFVLIVATSVRAESNFLVRTLTGKEHRGPLLKVQDWGLLLGKGSGRALAANEWLSLRAERTVLPPFPTDEHLVLGNGDRIPVHGLRLDDEKLYFRHRDLGDREVSLGLSGVALIWRLAPDGIVSGEKLRHRLLRGKRARDLVLLRNGDTLEGTLIGLKAGELTLEIDKKPVTARWVQVAAIALSSELLDRLRPKSSYGQVVVVPSSAGPGGRFTLTTASCDGTTFEGKTVFGATLRVPLERIASLNLFSESILPLGEFKPLRYDYFPYLDEQWGLSVDSSTTGGDLRIGGSTFDRGLGMHAHSRVRLALEGRFQRFDVTVGLDDQDAQGGEAQIVVLRDGKPVDLEKAGRLASVGGPLSLSIPVGGVKELTLEVRPGKRGPIRSVVNWADARLVK